MVAAVVVVVVVARAMHDFQEQCQVCGQGRKNMACRK